MSHSESKPVSSAAPLLRMAGVGEHFQGVRVLKDVQFEVSSGEVHVLAGENRAGKSTLIKILAGVHTEFEGRIEINGREIRPRTPLEANCLGIAAIRQELSLIGPMSVADNIFLGRNPACAGFVQDAEQREKAVHWTRQLALDLYVNLPAEHDPIAPGRTFQPSFTPVGSRR